MAPRFRVAVFNAVSPRGLSRLHAPDYQVGKAVAEPHAILLRSHALAEAEVPESVRAIGRCGTGVNNIPVEAMSRRGVPVFNAPGANANAVKELVLAGLLMAARNILPALRFVDGLRGTDEELAELVEKGKKHYAGVELPGRTLGVIGLGRIGSLVADAAIKLGMQVLGYDPEITVEAAWSLPSQVRKAHGIDEVFKSSEFITVHVPLLPATRALVNAERLALMRHGSVLLNFAREDIVDTAAVADALRSKRLAAYVCDFPGERLVDLHGVVALPHLGASTREAEENCAVMVADTLRDFLENGNVRHSVNFPEAVLPRAGECRIAIANANVPNMVGQISTALAEASLNIADLLNKSRGELAYTLIDIDAPVPASVIERVRSIHGVLSARVI